MLKKSACTARPDSAMAYVYGDTRRKLHNQIRFPSLTTGRCATEVFTRKLKVIYFLRKLFCVSQRQSVQPVQQRHSRTEHHLWNLLYPQSGRPQAGHRLRRRDIRDQEWSAQCDAAWTFPYRCVCTCVCVVLESLCYLQCKLCLNVDKLV